MKGRVISSLAGLLIGVVVLVLALRVGGTGEYVILGGFYALCAARYIYCRNVVAGRIRESLRARVDPSAGPPEGAQPVDGVVVERVLGATAEQDWRALRALLTHDFRVVDTKGRASGFDSYRRGNQAMAGAFAELHLELEAVVADPAEPDVLYAREILRGRPRRGPALNAITWERYVLAPGREQVREISTAGVLSVA